MSGLCGIIEVEARVKSGGVMELRGQGKSQKMNVRVQRVVRRVRMRSLRPKGMRKE